MHEPMKAMRFRAGRPVVTGPARVGTLVLLGLLLTACAAKERDAGGVRVDRYVVRGLVVALPDPATPGSELLVRHEPIPDYRNRDGKVIGMAEMVMPFPLAEGVALDGIRVGDKVELAFEVSWRPRIDLRVTAIRKLSPETVLRLGLPVVPPHGNEPPGPVPGVPADEAPASAAGSR